MNRSVFSGFLLCALVLTGVVGYGTGFAFDLFGSHYKELPLGRMSFSSGGDMQGSYHCLTVREGENGTALVTYEDAKWHHESRDIREYIVPASLLEDIKAIFISKKLARYEKAPKSPFVALDAATSSYSFSFGEESVRFSSTQTLPQDCYSSLREIKDLVAAACKNGQRLPGLVLKKSSDGLLPPSSAMEKGKFALKVFSYGNKTLNISIGNGLEEEKVIPLASKITPLDNPQQIIAEQNTEKTLRVPSLYNHEHSWKLQQRLEPGKYLLTISDYSTVFEIR